MAVSAGFTLLESVIAAVLMALMTLSIYSLFQVNIRAAKLSNDLDDADRILFAKMEEIRKLGTVLNWCSGVGSMSTSNPDCTSKLSSTNPQGYYSPPADKLPAFIIACTTDASTDSVNDLSKDLLLVELVTAIDKLNATDGVTISRELDDKPTHRLKIELTKTIDDSGYGNSRVLTRNLYLVPEVAKWCP